MYYRVSRELKSSYLSPDPSVTKNLIYEDIFALMNKSWSIESYRIHSQRSNSASTCWTSESNYSLRDSLLTGLLFFKSKVGTEISESPDNMTAFC